MSRTQHCFDHSVFVYKDKRSCYDNQKRQEIKEKICTWQIQIWLHIVKSHMGSCHHVHVCAWTIGRFLIKKHAHNPRLRSLCLGAAFSTSFKERGGCWYSCRNTSKVEICLTSLYVMGIGVIPQKGWRSTLQWNQYPSCFTLMAPMTPLPHPLRCLSFELCHSQRSGDGHWVVSVTP